MKQSILVLTLMATGGLTAVLAQNRACQLLTVDEIRKATGMDLEEPRPENSGAGDVNCTYSSSVQKNFSISLHEKGGKPLFLRNRQAAAKRMSVTSVASLGDDAYFASFGPVNQISVLRGDTAILLTIVGGKSGAQPLLSELARKALGRL